jgi:ribosomal protein L11 methyltransferase
VRISRENAKVNKVDARFVHASGLGHTLVARHAPYDLVFANILAWPLVKLAEPIRRAVKPGGYIVLSGLLRTQERFVRTAYLNRGFRLTDRIRRDAWSALVLRRG